MLYSVYFLLYFIESDLRPLNIGLSDTWKKRGQRHDFKSGGQNVIRERSKGKNLYPCFPNVGVEASK